MCRRSTPPWIDASSDQIHALIASAEGFSKGWAADVTEDEPNRITELGFLNRPTIYRFQWVRSAAAHEIEWFCKTGKEWQDTRLLVGLVQDGPRTPLPFARPGRKDETVYFVTCSTPWGGLLIRLQVAAEGKSPGPLFSANGVSYWHFTSTGLR